MVRFLVFEFKRLSALPRHAKPISRDDWITFGCVIAVENQLEQVGLYLDVPVVSQRITVLARLHCLLYCCFKEIRLNGIYNLHRFESKFGYMQCSADWSLFICQESDWNASAWLDYLPETEISDSQFRWHHAGPLAQGDMIAAQCLSARHRTATAHWTPCSAVH